ncbi:MAG: DNA-formamidopyrimidine glycosylase [Parcubacteria group bacterium]
MPELPEVENTVRSLNKLIIGSRIKKVWTDAPKLVRRGSFEELKKGIKNRKIINVKRRAKNIILSLEGGYALLIHLKMTGHFLIGKWEIKKNDGKETAVSLLKGALSEKVNDYIHIIFYLDDGREIALSDLRKFVKLIFGKEDEIYKEKGIYDAGTEALEMKFSEFHSVVSKSHKNIKTLLMDQTKIAGIGNIYSDDILFRAKIHPLRNASSLSGGEIKKLYASIKEVLSLAIRLGGTSISDYRNVKGEKGSYGEQRLVYRRDGKPCPRCKTPIKRIKIGSRSARFCPSCQSL